MKKKIINNIFLYLSILISIYVALGTNYVCPWRKFFNIYCAGCGVTRMFKSLLKLDFYQAFRYNQLFFILMLFGIIYLCYVCISVLFKKQYYRFNSNILWLLLILIVFFTILRNIPYFRFLVPMKV